MRSIRTRTLLLVGALALTLVSASPVAALDSPDARAARWAHYLDFAYVYSSADAQALAARLDGYAAESGVSLRDYLKESIEDVANRRGELRESELRHLAVGYLLDYLSTGDDWSLGRSVKAARALEDRLDRVENRYWSHYVMAHRALHEGRAREFTQSIMDLWLGVVVELEAPFDTYRMLSLNRRPSAGFVAALPYVYENVSRLILVRGPQMGMRDGLDGLGGIVMALADERVGLDPETVPAAASARDYVAAVAERLQSPASDGQSLSFTLTLLEAELAHDEARAILSEEGFSEEALARQRVAMGAYERALRQTRTLQGQVAVYSRALRQRGELDAARQRLAQPSPVRVPFTIERAIELYGQLHEDVDAWEVNGYRANGRDAYVADMALLWEEIQEASYNAAQAYFAEGVAKGAEGDNELAEAAARHARYLSFFERYVRAPKAFEAEGVPDSAFFAAHRAHKGIADTLLRRRGGNPDAAQLEVAAEHYQKALDLHALDPTLWSELALALELRGHESRYLEIAKRVAGRITRSQALDVWLGRSAEGTAALQALRDAYASDLALMYLGFAATTGAEPLQEELYELEQRRELITAQVATFDARRHDLARRRGEAITASQGPIESLLPPVAAPAIGGAPEDYEAPDPEVLSAEIREIAAAVDALTKEEARIEEQIQARDGALPLFAAALETAPLSESLGAQRHHPVHALVRRLVREQQRRLQ